MKSCWRGTSAVLTFTLLAILSSAGCGKKRISHPMTGCFAELLNRNKPNANDKVLAETAIGNAVAETPLSPPPPHACS